MVRKLVIDCDPGIDDAVALCMGLFDPRIEVLAITAVGGNVPASVASRNVQTIVAHLDPPRYPRLGAGSPPDDAPPSDARHIHGEDGLGNSGFSSSQLQNQHPSDKVICDAVRSAPESVTILCLGPLTNVARAFQRDPGLPALVDRLIMMGGSVDGVGNITPAAEFNMHYDPVSARAVFQSATTKTLVPLDVTRQVAFSLGLIEELPSELSRAGVFLRRVLPHYFRAAHQSLAQETISLHDAVALVAAVNPEMFEADYMAGDVESSGDLTRGATVFDQRPNREWRMNMEVVHTIDVEAVANTIVRNLQYAGQCTC